MQKLLSKIDALEKHIVHAAALQPIVSEASVAWHIEHSCLVITKITQTLQNSDPNKYQWKWNTMRAFVFLLRKFPRGRAKAPQSVMPDTNITKEHLHESIAEARKAVATLSTCSKNQYFLHPFFGDLNKASTTYFLGIHTNHHLQIIEDILQ
jgi:hypothetical protein